MPAWALTATGIDIAIRVTPRGGRDLLAAGTPDHFAARLAAAPVDGAANAALIALVAKIFGIARRDVTLIAGETSRLKRLRLSGAPQALAETAAALYEPKP
ncbi:MULTISPECIES: DUF167 domain-containing protein [Sphingomonas]|uniref:DUF167 domain-containing protein n=1 Tax=Sphingomonas TaxID=13687 RepID=UPI000835FE39|nr:DUF167 domain-containing protein [Sphingomonas sp. CCH10-B3]